MLVFEGNKAIEIIRAIADEYSRKIMLSGSVKPFRIEEISVEEHIPLSTCYRRVRDLENIGILKVDKIVLWEDGRKKFFYRTCLKNLSINLNSGRLTVEASPDKDLSEEPRIVWADDTYFDDEDGIEILDEATSTKEDGLLR